MLPKGEVRNEGVEVGDRWRTVMSLIHKEEYTRPEYFDVQSLALGDIWRKKNEPKKKKPCLACSNPINNTELQICTFIKINKYLKPVSLWNNSHWFILHAVKD